VFNNVDGVVYRDCAVRRSDFVSRWFVCLFCVGVLVIRVLVFTVFFIVLCSCIVSFMYIYSYLFFCTGVRTTSTV